MSEKIGLRYEYIIRRRGVGKNIFLDDEYNRGPYICIIMYVLKALLRRDNFRPEK